MVFASQMDGEAGWWTTSGKIGIPPCKAKEEGRQQQQFVPSRHVFLADSGGRLHAVNIECQGVSRCTPNIFELWTR